jgi:hypothetical protein
MYGNIAEGVVFGHKTVFVAQKLKEYQPDNKHDTYADKESVNNIFPVLIFVSDFNHPPMKGRIQKYETETVSEAGFLLSFKQFKVGKKKLPSQQKTAGAKNQD